MQEGLQQELAQMQARFPDAKPRDLKRFLMGYAMKADKAVPAYEAHLQWCVGEIVVIIVLQQRFLNY